ncbi:hypothetical protein [Marmoricola sp. RAF53]|uniref:hypothetical protein n=1 Tax=Marmoricola sp. RAF53 TaxID=3233059 RepID=UPI003F98397F
MRTVRLALLLLGTALGGYGVLLLAGTGFANVRATTFWLVGGVLVHDLVLAPLTLLAAAAVLAVRRPSAPLVAGFVLVASITVVAVPVLGRFGARADNPTLLDRDYVTGWVAVVAVIAIAVALTSWWSRRQRRRHPPPST